MATLLERNRRTIRAAVNPMDVSTVVSIFPKHIEEHKPTIQPGIFVITPGSYDNPAVLVVGPSSWWREFDEEQPLLEIPVSSIQIADSVVRDYNNGVLACNMGDSQPGLFYLPGAFSSDQIKRQHKPLLDVALAKQRNWYMTLVKMADILWARTNGNPLAISDDMRLGAQELGLAGNKEWTRDIERVEMVRCRACGALRNPNFPICQVCKAVADEAKAKELGLRFVV